jgi:hypothetical protein
LYQLVSSETNSLQARLDIGNADAVGIANLVDNALNMDVTAVLSRSISQKVGGNSIRGFMQTALANKQGELMVAVPVSGTFSKPAFAPDIQQIARTKIQGLVPDLDDPASITGRFRLRSAGQGTSVWILNLPKKINSGAEARAATDRTLRKEEKAQSTAAKLRGRFSTTWRWSHKAGPLIASSTSMPSHVFDRGSP